MILLDTHILVWWISNPEKLSEKAKKSIEKEQKSGTILISAISVWEIYLLVKKGRLRFTVDTQIWFDTIEHLPFVRFIPIDNQIAAKSVTLQGEFHADPADRMIVATAREKGASLITADERILKYQHVKAIW